MRLGIDLDGVVYPFVDVFTKYASQRLHRELPQPMVWDFPTVQWGITMEHFVGLMAQGAKEGHLWWTGEPIEGAREALTQLKADGHKIFILTDRAPKGGEGAAQAATYTWLRDNHIPYDGLFITRDKTGLGIDVLLDDGPHNIDKAMYANEASVVFDQPWNRHVQNCAFRAYGWSDFVDIIGQWTTALAGAA